MTKMAQKIKDRIEACVTLFGFEYHGKDGNVDPYYVPEKNRQEYLLFFDGNEQTVYNIEDVMNTPFIAEKTLSEVANEIEITAW